MSCTCWFCERGEAHPDERHPNFYPITGKLLKAESLDPNDVIPMEACQTCGHRREAKR